MKKDKAAVVSGDFISGEVLGLALSYGSPRPQLLVRLEKFTDDSIVMANRIY